MYECFFTLIYLFNSLFICLFLFIYLFIHLLIDILFFTCHLMLVMVIRMLDREDATAWKSGCNSIFLNQKNVHIMAYVGRKLRDSSFRTRGGGGRRRILRRRGGVLPYPHECRIRRLKWGFDSWTTACCVSRLTAYVFVVSWNRTAR